MQKLFTVGFPAFREIPGLLSASLRRSRKTCGQKVEPCNRVAIVLVLALTSIAFADANGYGILNFYPEQSENKTYVEHIVAVNQTWEGKLFTAFVNEPVFDRTKLSVTLSIFRIRKMNLSL